MKLKPCSCCKIDLTTKKIVKLSRFKDQGLDLLYFNCKECHSTMVLASKETMKKLKVA